MPRDKTIIAPGPPVMAGRRPVIELERSPLPACPIERSGAFRKRCRCPSGVKRRFRRTRLPLRRHQRYSHRRRVSPNSNIRQDINPQNKIGYPGGQCTNIPPGSPNGSKTWLKVVLPYSVHIAPNDVIAAFVGEVNRVSPRPPQHRSLRQMAPKRQLSYKR